MVIYFNVLSRDNSHTLFLVIVSGHPRSRSPIAMATIHNDYCLLLLDLYVVVQSALLGWFGVNSIRLGANSIWLGANSTWLGANSSWLGANSSWYNSSIAPVSRRSRVRIPLKPWFFQASPFQLLKLENLLRWSFFTLIYNRSSNIWIISYTSHQHILKLKLVSTNE